MAAATSEELELRRKIEGHLDHLPVLPMAIARLMALDQNDESYFDDVVEILEAEPNFAARILIAANSAASAPVNPISTLDQAVARIGSKGATSLVLALSVTRVFVPRDPWEQSLWRHAVQVAQAARMLAARCGDPELNPEEAYVGALLHDIGRFVMFQEAPDRLRLIDEGDWDTPQALIDQERAICGLTHPEIGSVACRKWQLPARIEQTVRNHHSPTPDGFDTPEAKLTAIIRLADIAMFPSAMPGEPSLHETMSDGQLEDFLRPKAPPFLKLSAPKLREIIAASASQAEAACEALGIPAPTPR